MVNLANSFIKLLKYFINILILLILKKIIAFDFI